MGRCWWPVCSDCQESPAHSAECRVLAACLQVHFFYHLRDASNTHYGNGNISETWHCSSHPPPSSLEASLIEVLQHTVFCIGLSENSEIF